MRKTGLITTDRDHLVQISTALARALPLGALLPPRHQNPLTPLTIAINGSLADGKKIFPDFVRDALFGSNFTLRGRYNYDEINTGNIHGIPHDISFLNLGWERGYNRKALATTLPDRKAIQYFHKDRLHPGISFIHNATASIGRRADISIWLESKFKPIIRLANKPRINRQATPIQQHFTEATCHNIWVRWCEIHVNRRSLLTHPPLRHFMDSLSPADSDYYPDSRLRFLAQPIRSRFNRHAQDGVIPRYGYNLPRTITTQNPSP